MQKKMEVCYLLKKASTVLAPTCRAAAQPDSLAPEQLKPLTEYRQQHRRVVCHAEAAKA